MDEYGTDAAFPDSSDTSEPVDTETEVSEGSTSGSEGETLSETLAVSNEYNEMVLDYLDYINSGVICTVVLLGAILGTLVIRCFLDRCSE